MLICRDFILFSIADSIKFLAAVQSNIGTERVEHIFLHSDSSFMKFFHSTLSKFQDVGISDTESKS